MSLHNWGATSLLSRLDRRGKRNDIAAAVEEMAAEAEERRAEQEAQDEADREWDVMHPDELEEGAYCAGVMLNGDSMEDFYDDYYEDPFWEEDFLDRLSSEFCGVCCTRHHPSAPCQDDDRD